MSPAEAGHISRNSLELLVPQAGLEPARPCEQQILSVYIIQSIQWVIF